MILALLLASAPVMTAVDAERAFAADAQKLGQWSAFRRYATTDALMFTPQPTKAQDFLKDRKDPPKAIEWWPAATYMSCDGRMAINTGPFKAPGGGRGYFTTVWIRQADGSWKWVYDGGGEVATDQEKPVEVQTLTAECSDPRPKQAAVPGEDARQGVGVSADRTLTYGWGMTPAGGRVFSVLMWNGESFDEVLRNEIKPPRPTR